MRLSGRWGLLAVLSLLLAGGLRLGSVPAALLLGPMLIGVVFALRGEPLDVPRWAFNCAQSVVGCMVARSVTPSILITLGQDWHVMGLVVATVMISGVIVGLLLIRFGTLPGSTAAWGTTPGGATVMTALADAYGADVRMVAFMQYLRLFIVVLTASAVSRLLLGYTASLPEQGAWSLGFDAPLLPLLQTLLLIVVSGLLTPRLRLPSGPLLVPMLVGATLNSAGIMTLTLPLWLVWCAYAILGWFIGLRFTAATVRYAVRAVPQMLCATLSLILLCCVAAWMLTVWMHVDGLTAYLATSPGGLDTVIAIALDSGCDVPFVMTLQTLRLFAVVLVGPVLARMIAARAG